MGKIIREIFDIKIRNWTLALSILICIVISNYYLTTVDFGTLTNFKDRTIGQNILLGVNGEARTTTYLVIVILFSVCFILQTVVFSFLLKKFEKFYSSDNVKIKIYYTNPEKSYFIFNTVPSNQLEDYLVRVSTQWQWMSEDVTKLIISSSGNLVISELYIREGD